MGTQHRTLLFLVGLVAGALLLAIGSTSYARAEDERTSRLITVYDRGVHIAFLSNAQTMAEALEQADVTLDPRDTVEPSRDEELVAPEYKVNIYRARPVVVVDGVKRTKIMTPYQTPKQIAKSAGFTLYPEDVTTMRPSTDFIGDGAGLQMHITRAVPFTFDLYGNVSAARTQGATVQAMLDEKGIQLTPADRVSVPLDRPITAGMKVRVWREGKHTTAIERPIAYSVKFIYDADRPLGYTAVQTQGVPGVRVITYEVEIEDGKELSRVEIARMVKLAPIQQVEVLGIKGLGQGLTKEKGTYHFTDSNGVTHRETYYDLNMSRVMQNCGQAGRYFVRAVDGVKVDADGYVIIAAHLGRYPRCSVVETSVGPGKVYDTGGFAAVHPDGFDIATDWSRADGI